MNEGPKTVRLSILVFDDQGTLWRSIIELLRHGLAAEQICLVGIASSLAQLSLPENIDGPAGLELRSFLAAPYVPIRADDKGDIVGQCGSAHKDSFALGTILTDFRWMDQKLRENLVLNARRGAVLLFVRATSPDQHAFVGRILLRHGRHNLQTHEFTERNDGENEHGNSESKPAGSEQP